MSGRELKSLRDELWQEVRNLPGVVTVGLGAFDDGVALVIFLDNDGAATKNLPRTFKDMPVLHEKSCPAVAHSH